MHHKDVLCNILTPPSISLSPIFHPSFVLLHRRLESDSFLCDCQLQWLPAWLVARGLQAGVSATCAHPEILKGSTIFEAPVDSFVCGQYHSKLSQLHCSQTELEGLTH